MKDRLVLLKVQKKIQKVEMRALSEMWIGLENWTVTEHKPVFIKKDIIITFSFSGN